MPGDSGYAQFSRWPGGRQGALHFAAASRVSISELLGGSLFGLVGEELCHV